MNRDILAKRITEARTDKGISQKDLAAALGISATRLNYWEKEKAEPDVSFIVKICDILNVSGDWLIGLSDNKEKPGVHKNDELNEIKQLLIKKVLSMDENLLKNVSEYVDFLVSRHDE